MDLKHKREIWVRIVIIGIILACLPTMIIALMSVIQGKHGEIQKNYWGQPLYPLLTFGTLFAAIILLMITFRKETKP